MILKVSGLGYLLNLPFGAIGPLGLHGAGCTLEFQLYPHWLALELLVGDGTGAEYLSQLQCGMWLVALPARGDHDVPLLIMTERLPRFLYFGMDFSDDFVVDDPLAFFYFLEGEFAANMFSFGSHVWIFLFRRVWCA